MKMVKIRTNIKFFVDVNFFHKVVVPKKSLYSGLVQVASSFKKPSLEDLFPSDVF